MPATSSSLIDPALDHLVALAETAHSSDVDLLAVLDLVVDPRKPKGVRHRLVVILKVAVCGVLAGARSYVAIGEWASDLDAVTRTVLGISGAVPSESTIRRTLQALNADAFDDQLGRWAQQRTTPASGVRRRIAVDGKTLRGSGADGGPGRHLLAAFDHVHGVVLAQVDVEAKTNEIPMFATLLDHLDLTGAIVTADAMHAQRAHATYLAGRGAHFVLTVKKNQPTLHAQLAALPWRDIPAATNDRERGHGRAEWRTVKVTEVSTGLGFPHAAQAIQITRRRRPTGRKRWSTGTVYAITSLTALQITPNDLADVLRGHWSIEVQLHWVRDTAWDEDRSQVRTANGPRIMASLRNLAIAVLRLTATTNLTAALRHHDRRPDRPLQAIMTC